MAFLLAMFPIFVNSVTGLGEGRAGHRRSGAPLGRTPVAHLHPCSLYHAAPLHRRRPQDRLSLALVGSIVGEVYRAATRASATSFFRVSSRLTRRWCLRRLLSITISGDRWNRPHRPVEALVLYRGALRCVSNEQTKDEAMSMSVNPVIRVMILCAMALFAGTLSPHAQKLDKLKKIRCSRTMLLRQACAVIHRDRQDISGKRAFDAAAAAHHRQRFRQYRDRQQTRRLRAHRCIRLVQKHCERRKDSGIRGLSRHQCHGLASLQPIPTPESLVGRKIAAALTDSPESLFRSSNSLKNLDTRASSNGKPLTPAHIFPCCSAAGDVIAGRNGSDRPALSKAGAARIAGAFRRLRGLGIYVLGFFW